MKGNEKIVGLLNELLADELTAINQYFLHAEMCKDWGYNDLYEQVKKRAIDEMKHAENLIERILFLEGRPIVNRLNEIQIGEDVKKQLEIDLEAEEKAVENYNRAIALAGEMGDNGTKELLEKILQDEEGHLDWLETQLHLIKEVGLQNYLSGQS
jgi:bacterioferritin